MREKGIAVYVLPPRMRMKHDRFLSGRYLATQSTAQDGQTQKAILNHLYREKNPNRPRCILGNTRLFSILVVLENSHVPIVFSSRYSDSKSRA